MLMKSTLKITIVTLLISSMGCFGLPSPVFAQTRPTPTTFSGEQIYRGLLLGEAPVSQFFPEIWAKGDRGISGMEEMDEQVIAQINAEDRTFMGRFAVEMQSGDHLRIETALQEAGALTIKAMQNLGYLDPAGMPAEGRDGAECFALARVAVAAYVVAVVVVVWAWLYYKPRPGFIGDKTALERDILVNLVAERLWVKS